MDKEALELKETVELVNKHGERVGALAYYLSKYLGLDDEYVFYSYIAGRYHDFGKLAIPVSILNKPGKLTEQEQAIIHKHPAFSVELVSMCGFGPNVKEAILSHHEDFCGTGYPQGLSGEDIPLLSRILRICDTFDALMEVRSYRERLDFITTMTIMEKEFKAGRFDPRIYKVFKEMIKEQLPNVENGYYVNGDAVSSSDRRISIR